jgi:transposase InsO family protein
MDTTSAYRERVSAIHLLRSGHPAVEVAAQMGRSLAWVYKWQKRFLEHGDWNDLRDRSRAPKKRSRRISEDMRREVTQARSQLEAEACQPKKLCYIGGYAIRNRLHQEGVCPLPSRASIERIISAEGMTRPRQATETKIPYPHLQPTQPHQLTQVDIVPRYLPGGGCVSCFNAIDVVSRYPTGRQFLSKRSQDAFLFVFQVLQDLGFTEYLQLDNEGCFSGGSTHPGVIGKVVRLLLYFGVQPVFSPCYLPESNGVVERFHQDYTANTWDKEEMRDLPAVQANSAPFFELYRHSGHHSALGGLSPAGVHWARPTLRLSQEFQPPKGKLPITEGKVHFIRIVQADHTISVANITWEVPSAKVNEGVWVTLAITQQGATLRVYDAAPDAVKRSCLVAYPFPVKEPVQPLRPEFHRSIVVPVPWWSLAANLFRSTVLARLPAWLSTML